MSVNNSAINNSALLTVNKPLVDTTGFAPVLTAAIDSSLNVTVTDGSTYGAGDSISKINVRLHDQHGNTLYGEIDATSGSRHVVIATDSGFNQKDTITVTATIVSTLGVISTGGATGVLLVNGNSYSLGNFTSREFTTAVG